MERIGDQAKRYEQNLQQGPQRPLEGRRYVILDKWIRHSGLPQALGPTVWMVFQALLEEDTDAAPHMRDGAWVTCSVGNLMTITALSDSTVRRAIDELKECALLLTWVRGGRPLRHKVNYDLLLEIYRSTAPYIPRRHMGAAGRRATAPADLTGLKPTPHYKLTLEDAEHICAQQGHDPEREARELAVRSTIESWDKSQPRPQWAGIETGPESGPRPQWAGIETGPDENRPERAGPGAQPCPEKAGSSPQPRPERAGIETSLRDQERTRPGAAAKKPAAASRSSSLNTSEDNGNDEAAEAPDTRCKLAERTAGILRLDPSETPAIAKAIQQSRLSDDTVLQKAFGIADQPDVRNAAALFVHALKKGSAEAGVAAVPPRSFQSAKGVLAEKCDDDEDPYDPSVWMGLAGGDAQKAKEMAEAARARAEESRSHAA